MVFWTNFMLGLICTWLEKTRRFCRQVNIRKFLAVFGLLQHVQRSSLGWCSQLTYMETVDWIHVGKRGAMDRASDSEYMNDSPAWVRVQLVPESLTLLVPLSKALYSNCSVVRRSRKAVGPAYMLCIQILIQTCTLKNVTGYSLVVRGLWSIFAFWNCIFSLALSISGTYITFLYIEHRLLWYNI